MSKDNKLIADGFDEAKVGIMRRAGRDNIAVYDYDKRVDIFMHREGWTDEEAKEWMECNELSAWLAEDKTPAFLLTNASAFAPSTLL
jgi:hypothetical protein|eukprot:COSAG02_NODE_537_length_20638_cov_49.009738_9_plen_87_part_00